MILKETRARHRRGNRSRRQHNPKHLRVAPIYRQRSRRFRCRLPTPIIDTVHAPRNRRPKRIGLPVQPCGFSLLLHAQNSQHTVHSAPLLSACQRASKGYLHCHVGIGC